MQPVFALMWYLTNCFVLNKYAMGTNNGQQYSCAEGSSIYTCTEQKMSSAVLDFMLQSKY